MAEAPPGGGPGAVVVATSTPNPAPVVTDPKLEVNPPAAVVTDPAPLELTPAAKVDPGTNQEIPDFGEQGLNVAADFFVNSLGLDLNGRELVEAGKGNFHLLEAKIEVMGDKAKGAGPMLALAKESVGRIHSNAKVQQEANTKLVHEAVGGEANWNAVKTWAGSSLNADQLKQASEALASGGFAAQAMAQHLLGMAKKNPAVTLRGADVTNPGGAAVSLQGVEPLSKEQYKIEYRKLVEAKGITGAAKSEELQALNRRRLLRQ